MKPQVQTLQTKLVARVKERMQEIGISQTDLSERIGVAPSEVSHIVCGRRMPSVYLLRQLCKALSCRADWLLYLRDKEKIMQWRIHNYQLDRDIFGILDQTDHIIASVRGEAQTYQIIREHELVHALEERHPEIIAALIEELGLSKISLTT